MRTIVLFLLLRGHGASGLWGGLETFMDRMNGHISTRLKNYAEPTHPNLKTLCESPPVFAVPGFMSREECNALIAAAESGAFPPIPYGTKHRIFTGTKWAAAGTDDVASFLERTCAVFGDVPPSRFEPITVTRYCEGQYQAEHLDARLNVKRTPGYLRTGGQRIAQLIVYLQEPTAGGETKFFDNAFQGLAVEPEVGTALIFPVATLDGIADERYLHSGEPVKTGTKWIVGTWLMETERSDGDDVNKAIDELWKLVREPTQQAC